MKLCTDCGHPLDPDTESLKTGRCLFCRVVAEAAQATRIRCFDGSPCTRPDHNCNDCQWLWRPRNDRRQ